MATTSSRSFNQYSGLDRHQAMQPWQNQGNRGVPSAFDRLQMPEAERSQSTQAMKMSAPWAMGLAERGATPSGRSFRDPARQAERLIRGTGRPGQLQGAMILDNINQSRLDPIGQIMQQAGALTPTKPTNPDGQLIPGSSPGSSQWRQNPRDPDLFRSIMGSPAFTKSREAIGGALFGNQPRFGGAKFGGAKLPIRPY